MTLGTWWTARRRRHQPEAEPPADSDVDAFDVAELDLRLAAVEADAASERDRRLAALLHPIAERRVPVRVVEAAPGLHAARIRFADGTAVLVQGISRGDVGVLASWMRDTSLRPPACVPEVHGTELVFTSPRRNHRLTVHVTGFDQPD
jgi:hypothetical protein